MSPFKKYIATVGQIFESHDGQGTQWQEIEFEVSHFDIVEGALCFYYESGQVPFAVYARGFWLMVREAG